jgi:LmbE family N-acetylglucosaminyl deacetylase
VVSTESLGTILGIWAHPDDETYLSAGIMADAVRRGSRVVCVTATRGEGGSFDEERWPTATMGKVREQELMRCFEILGVREHHWLDYYDGTCALVDRDEGIGRIRGFIEDVGPDTVLTFGPDGMTGHDDHRSVSTWTTEAFASGARPGARLCYATVTPEWRSEWAPKLEPFNVFMEPGTPLVTPREELEIDFDLPDEILELKMDAVAAHESQVEGMMEVFGRSGLRDSQASEFFRLGARWGEPG